MLPLIIILLFRISVIEILVIIWLSVLALHHIRCGAWDLVIIINL